MDYEMVLKEAHEEGQKALEKCIVPMYKWASETVPLGEKYDFENKPYELHGECGVAWVLTYERGNGAFVKYLKSKYGDVGKHCYYKGWNVPTDDMVLGKYDQEVEPKYAYCKAYAHVLCGYGIKASAYKYLT